MQPDHMEDFVAQVKERSVQGMILSVDPGLKTGLAVLRRGIGDEVHLVASAELDWLQGAEACDQIIAYGLAATVVCERFTITVQTAKNSQAQWSMYAIGCLMWSCDQAGMPIAFQSPADAKSLVTNDKLKRLELWHRGGAGHAMDAIRHGVLYLVRSGWTSSKLVS